MARGQEVGFDELLLPGRLTVTRLVVKAPIPDATLPSLRQVDELLPGLDHGGGELRAQLYRFPPVPPREPEPEPESPPPPPPVWFYVRSPREAGVQVGPMDVEEFKEAFEGGDDGLARTTAAWKVGDPEWQAIGAREATRGWKPRVEHASARLAALNIEDQVCVCGGGASSAPPQHGAVTSSCEEDRS